MIRKIFAFVLCGMMLLCFVACGENSAVNTNEAPRNESQASAAQNPPVFETKNITRITFYGNYGTGQGSDVPETHLAEIIHWLGSFTVDKQVDDILPPGTNTYFVEIEYADGAVIKQGLDTVEFEGRTYYTKGDKQPECFLEIVSQAG